MKKFICGFLAVLLLVTLCGCAPSLPEEPQADGFFNEEARFIVMYLEKNGIITANSKYDIAIMRDSATGVMYMIIEDGGRCGITPLLCDDGTPIIYDPITNSVG